ncbi:hypothetical protein EXN66_Car015965 [Channa argus]|uniref:Uncharacterized protein n=1 Tax=Channa argus TaxID=215402 RepID=A0A6G1QDE5_CHAAH|nr:hypothetical protein EXN66_Car015965 [Channa argus]
MLWSNQIMELIPRAYGITPPPLKPRVLYSVLLRCPDSLSPPLFTCYVAIETPSLFRLAYRPIGHPE